MTAARTAVTSRSRLAAVHLLLMTLFLAAPAAAVTVGTLVLDGGVTQSARRRRCS